MWSGWTCIVICPYGGGGVSESAWRRLDWRTRRGGAAVCSSRRGDYHGGVGGGGGSGFPAHRRASLKILTWQRDGAQFKKRKEEKKEPFLCHFLFSFIFPLRLFLFRFPVFSFFPRLCFESVMVPILACFTIISSYNPLISCFLQSFVF